MDDKVLKVLEEMRDLQKEFLANQKTALVRQEKAMEKQKKTLIFIPIFLLLYLALAFLVPYLLK